MDLLRTLDRARTWVVLLAAATIALVVCFSTYDQFILPKAVWIKLLTEILAVLTVARLAAGGDLRLRVHVLNLVLIVYVGWKAVSWFWADSRSLAGDDIRWWVTLLVWSLLFQDWLAGARRQRLMLCAGALTLSALVLSLWVLLQDFNVAFSETWVRQLIHWPAAVRDPLRWFLERLTGGVAKLPDWRGWLWAGLGNTNHIADYLALLFPMIAMQYLLARGKWRAILTLATLVAAYGALIACFSVGSNGGLILAALVFGALLIVHESREFWQRRLLRLAVLSAFFAASTAFYVFPHALNPHPGGIFRQAFASERWHAGWPTRVAIWLTSLEVVRGHPLLGVGAGNFTYAYTKTLSPRVLRDPDLRPYAGRFTNAAHNEPLQVWVETGVVGLLLLLLLWGLFARSALRGLSDEPDAGERRLRIVLLAMMVAFVGHSLMNFTLQLPTSSFLFVGLMAVAATVGRRRDEFELTVRSAYPGLEIDIETSGMRRIESVGFRLAPSVILRGAVAVAAIGLGIAAMAGSLRPLAADALFNSAKMARMQGALPRAEDCARRALALSPDHHHARKLLGRVLLETVRYGEARDALEKVRERETVYDFFKELGWAYWHLGDRDQAGQAWAIYFGRCPSQGEYDARFFKFFVKQFPEKLAELPMAGK